MRLRRWLACSLGAALVACGSAPPPPPAPVPPPEPDEHEAPAPEPPPAAPTTVDTPERSRPPSTASYEEAMSSPEALGVHDDRPQLSDAQLTGPMRGAVTGCRIPPNTKVTIRTAVQNGRAIGVTVDVRIVRPKSTRPVSKAVAKAQAKAQAKTIAKITACVDHNVRAVVWPPSQRRDSFTTEF